MTADTLQHIWPVRERGEKSDSITLAQLSVDMYHTPDCPPATYPLEATIVRVLQDSGIGGN